MIKDAIIELRKQFGAGPRETVRTGRPDVSIYRDGFDETTKGAETRVHRVVAEFYRKANRAGATDEITEYLHDKAEEFVDWLHENRPNGMLVWWGSGINVNIYEDDDGYVASVTFGLCKRVPV